MEIGLMVRTLCANMSELEWSILHWNVRSSCNMSLLMETLFSQPWMLHACTCMRIMHASWTLTCSDSQCRTTGLMITEAFLEILETLVSPILSEFVQRWQRRHMVLWNNYKSIKKNLTSDMSCIAKQTSYSEAVALNNEFWPCVLECLLKKEKVSWSDL